MQSTSNNWYRQVKRNLRAIPWCNCKLVTISFFEIPPLFLGFPGGASVKESACQCRRCKRLRFNRWFNPWIGKILWRRAWQPTLVLLPGESHGQRSSAGYSPWGRRLGHAREHAHVCDNTQSLSSSFFFLLAMPCGMWDLSSLTRDWTQAPWSGRAKS